MRYTRRQIALFNQAACRADSQARADRIEEAVAARVGDAQKLAALLRG